jgi:hypothetical protein
MLLRGKAASSVEPLVETAEEPDEDASLKRMLWIVIFVSVTVAASLSVYLLSRPANRHLEPTPYDTLIGQLRASMSEEDVLALFRSAGDGNARAEVKAYDEVSAGTSRRIITYKIGSEEPLKVRLGGPTGHTAAEWCYRDHCYDNID